MPKFQIFTDSNREHRWRLQGLQGDVVAASVNGYREKAECRHALRLVREHAAEARVDDLTLGPKLYPGLYRFEISKDNYDEFRWAFVAGSNEPLAVSRAYSQKEDCKRSIEAMKADAPTASIEDLSAARLS